MNGQLTTVMVDHFVYHGHLLITCESFDIAFKIKGFLISRKKLCDVYYYDTYILLFSKRQSILVRTIHKVNQKFRIQ